MNAAKGSNNANTRPINQTILLRTTHARGSLRRAPKTRREKQEEIEKQRVQQWQ
jgi:hypothetical protein